MSNLREEIILEQTLVEIETAMCDGHHSCYNCPFTSLTEEDGCILNTDLVKAFYEFFKTDGKKFLTN